MSRNFAIAGVILAVALIVLAGLLLSRWQPAIPAPSTALPASRTPTTTSSPLPPTVTMTATPTPGYTPPTPIRAAIEITPPLPSDTPEGIPVTSPGTGGMSPNIGGLLVLFGIALGICGVLRYTRIKKL